MAVYKYGFIGAGRMATALAGGLVEVGLAEAGQVIASDPSPAIRDKFAAENPSVAVTADNAEVAAAANTIILAVKPQVMGTVLEGLTALGGGNPLIVSIAAGVTLATIESGLGDAARVVRVMPNTPCLIGRGAMPTAVANGRRMRTCRLWTNCSGR